MDFREATTIEKGHGRTDKRSIVVSSLLADSVIGRAGSGLQSGAAKYECAGDHQNANSLRSDEPP